MGVLITFPGGEQRLDSTWVCHLLQAAAKLITQEFACDVLFKNI